jgi:hypothetical protein
MYRESVIHACMMKRADEIDASREALLYAMISGILEIE